jgi:hypothetical protein
MEKSRIDSISRMASIVGAVRGPVSIWRKVARHVRGG